MNIVGKRYILAGGLIDGSGAEVRKNVCLVVEDGVISAIEPVSRLPREARAAADDFSHCIILPALIDCSLYLSRSPALDQQAQLSAKQAGLAERATLIAKHLDYCHAHGVLGVADGDGHNPVVRHRNGRKERSEIDIRTAGGDFLKIAYSGSITDEEDALPRLDRGLRSVETRIAAKPY